MSIYDIVNEIEKLPYRALYTYLVDNAIIDVFKTEQNILLRAESRLSVLYTECSYGFLSRTLVDLINSVDICDLTAKPPDTFKGTYKVKR